MHEIIGEYMGTIALVGISGALVAALTLVLRYVILMF